MKNNTLILPVLTFFIYSCSVQKQIHKSATEKVLNDSAMRSAHVGISIYEPETGKYWFNYQGDKYFVPASNTKIPTCYAAMKYLGDSLIGIRYGIPEEKKYDNVIVLQPTGDPSFLHEDFNKQPVFQFLTAQSGHVKFAILDTVWNDEPWGSGWSWNDYQEGYMAERSSFPIYGNAITVRLNEQKNRNLEGGWQDTVKLFSTGINFFDSLINTKIYKNKFSKLEYADSFPRFEVRRALTSNDFVVSRSSRRFATRTFSFANRYNSTTLEILGKAMRTRFGYVHSSNRKNGYTYECPDCGIVQFTISKWDMIHSQPTDSLLKPLMHRSDNFFAEQALLMVSNELLGVMNDGRVIDTILKTDFKDLPHKPRWADGSGLSRYNLFTPQDFVFILNKMKNEFGMDRIKEVFPSGNEGTLSNLYVNDQGFIFAKTGTLSGVVALSGFLYTKKNKMLIFSVLVNNHQASAPQVRKAIEKFITGLREQY